MRTHLSIGRLHPPDRQFVYPFTLEPHVLTLESSRRSTIAAHTAKREDYLQQREQEKERRKKEALRRIAPGFEPQAVLVPSHKYSNSMDSGLSPPGVGGSGGGTGHHQRSRSVMDDLVESLAALDAAKSAPPPSQALSPPAFPPPPPPVNQRLT
ncbi:hypothetical protein H1R20_g9617, partial [Candolleomyces eurysporus]